MCRVGFHLGGDDFLLEPCQHLLRFKQGQTQSGDVTEAAGPVDLHLLVAGFWRCRSGENVTDQAMTLNRRVYVMTP